MVAQTSGKSLAMTPVMVWSMAVGGMSNQLVDWRATAADTGDVTVLLMASLLFPAGSDGSSLFDLGLFCAHSA